MYLVHFADRTVSDPLHGVANVIGRMPLVPHLRLHALLPSGFGQATDFVHRMSQRLLTIDVFAAMAAYGLGAGWDPARLLAMAVAAGGLLAGRGRAGGIPLLGEIEEVATRLDVH